MKVLIKCTQRDAPERIVKTISCVKYSSSHLCFIFLIYYKNELLQENKEVLLEKAFDKCHNAKKGLKSIIKQIKKKLKKREIKILVYA